MLQESLRQFRKITNFETSKNIWIASFTFFFDGQVVTRNSCRVKFSDKMTLSIGKEYHDKLKQFQTMVQKKTKS